jgi:hypothetical protein
VVHGGGHVRRDGVGELQPHLGIVLGQRHAVRAAHGDHFAHHVQQEGARLRVAADRADGLAHGGRGAREAHQEDELLPDLAQDLLRQFGLDAAGQAGGQQRLAARRARAVELAEQQPLHGPGLADHARRGDGGGDVADAAHDLARVEGGAQGPVLQHAVLERDHRRVRSHQGTDLRQRLFGVPQLHGQHHHVDHADAGRVVGDAHLGQVHGFGAFDAQALAAHRLQVRAARDEVHLGAPQRQPRPRNSRPGRPNP